MNTLLLGQISKFRALRKPFVLHIPYYTTLSERFTNQHSCKLSQPKVIGGSTCTLLYYIIDTFYPPTFVQIITTESYRWFYTGFDNRHALCRWCSRCIRGYGFWTCGDPRTRLITSCIHCHSTTDHSNV